VKILSEIKQPLQYEFVVDQKHVINYAQKYQFKIFPFPKNHILPIEHYIPTSTNQFLSNSQNSSVIGFDIDFTRSFSKYHWSFFLPSCLVVCITGTSFIIPPKAIPGRMSILVTLFLVQIQHYIF
jgi:hypothetical protein